MNRPARSRSGSTRSGSNRPSNRGAAYRELLFTAPGAEKHISGVILYDETIRQKIVGRPSIPGTARSRAASCPASRSMPVRSRWPRFPGETITEGLDGLRERLAEYRGLGARFAKWRAVIDIGAGIPTGFSDRGECQWRSRAMRRSARRPAIVPIVEPEVLMDGDHTIERCEEVTDAALTAVFDALFTASRAPRGHRAETEHGHRRQEVHDAGRAAAGGRCDRYAACGAGCRRRYPESPSCPAARARREATLHLSLMNRAGDLPWQLSFSYGRALQQSTLDAWRGEASNVTDRAAGIPAPRAAERTRPQRKLRRRDGTGCGLRLRTTDRGPSNQGGQASATARDGARARA